MTTMMGRLLLVVWDLMRLSTVIVFLSQSFFRSVSSSSVEHEAADNNAAREGFPSATVDQGTSTYTTLDDMSWAIVSRNVSDKLGQRQLYENFIDACYKASSRELCEEGETHRLFMNQYQPASVYNYSEMGFMKTRAPDHLMKLIYDFWNANHKNLSKEWSTVNVYHNDWEVPSNVTSVDNETLGGGRQFQEIIAEAARDMLEQWTGMRQVSVSTYGVRVYYEGAILAPHVDRMPLVSSAIINVAQGNLEEDWPLEVYDHSGVAHNVTMEPGDMVYYESHSVIHGRPFPLRGSGAWFANIFIHYEPLGPLNAVEMPENDGLPPYIIPGSSWETEWRESNPQGWTRLIDPFESAERGDLLTLEYILKVQPSAISKTDTNGWQALHYACRAGQLDVVKYLVEQGADIHEAAGDWTPLDIADEYLGEDNAVSTYLRGKGPGEEL